MFVNIRPATLDDVSAILAIEGAAPTAAHWTREQYVALIEFGVVLVAEREAGVTGFICVREVAGEWEIENIVVPESVRRHGIGQAMLRVLLRKMQDAGGSAVWLEVRESNLAARRFYEKNGFRECGRRAQYYQQPTEDALLYQLQLS